jgi:hypothetical protein
MNHAQMIKPMLIGVGVLFVLGLAGLPVLTYLPLLIFLACPLMMMLMMGSMNHGGDAHHDEQHDHSPARHTRHNEP